MDEIAYNFDGPVDARTYLAEVAMLWLVWVVGLVAVLVSHGAVLIVFSIGLIVVLLVLARPLLVRAEALVPVNKKEGNAAQVALRGGTTRDRVLREFAYGRAPIEAALATAGLNRRWVYARDIVIAVTILGLVFVVWTSGS